MLSRISLLLWCFAVVASIEPETNAQAAQNASSVALLNSRPIEVLIRSRFAVPPDYDIAIGSRSPSDTANFDTLPVTFVHSGKQTTVNFLISKDGNTLARLEAFDIKTNPALAINVDNRPVRGNPAAKVRIINFDDLECPCCAMLNSETLPETLEHYKDLINIVYEDFPIEGHPWAMRAAVDANCLGSLKGSAYWTYVDYVHNHQQEVSSIHSDLSRSFQKLDIIATTIGGESKVNAPELTACLKAQDESGIESSLKLGRSLGLDSTPQMFVNGERLPAGARPTSELWPAIDRALKSQGIQPPTASPGDATKRPTTNAP
jgi:protein-disulfide isomerase